MFNGPVAVMTDDPTGGGALLAFSSEAVLLVPVDSVACVSEAAELSALVLVAVLVVAVAVVAGGAGSD